MQAYRILSMDGGGPWSLIQAKALSRLFGGETQGREILEKFDLVAGNSGGAVVASALACDFTPDEIFGFFYDKTARCRFFQKTWYSWLTRWGDLGPRYRTDKKIVGLKSVLRNDDVLDTKLTRLPEMLGLKTHFLITAFDYDKERAVYFRSNGASLAGSPNPRRPPVTLAQAVHASSNAPINYFNKPAVFGDGRRHWDGGLSGLNNPVFAAVIEALANGQPRECIQALSIGTGTVMLPLEDESIHPPWARKRKHSWLVADIRKAVTTILDDPPDAATFHTYVALGHPLPPSGAPIRVVRMNPVIQPQWDAAEHKWRPWEDDPEGKRFRALIDLDLDALRQDEIERIQGLCDRWLADNVPNQPIRAGEDPPCNIGHDRFSNAEAAWNSL